MLIGTEYEPSLINAVETHANHGTFEGSFEEH
jgi:hypothetical protein